MQELNKLQEAAAAALKWAQSQDGVREAEAFVAANDNLLTRLDYTSHIPCEGVLEPKSCESFGIGLRVVFEDGDQALLGFGQETGDVGEAAVRSAFAKAKDGAVADPTFECLPKPTGEEPILSAYHDPALMDLPDEGLVALGWEAMQGAMEEFEKGAEKLGEDPKALGFLLGGDVTVLQERMAIASTHMPDVQTDETTLIMASFTAMVEARHAKGTGWLTGAKRPDFTKDVGAEAARNAIASVDGRRVKSGKYKVVFGPQAVTDLLTHIILPSLKLGNLYASSSYFLGKLMTQVADAQISLYDDGALPGHMGSKRITCEGLPTGRTDLIKDGVVIGTLANDYESRRIMADPQAKEKLGVDPKAHAAAFVPRNGFRFQSGGGRGFAMPPGTACTNVFFESNRPRPREDLLREVGDGIYVGRIWYTYPVNGLTAGDFTTTCIADSYLIEGGQLGAPLQPNVIRINDNISKVLNHIIGVGDAPRGVIVWAADEVVHAPDLAVVDVNVTAIADFLTTSS
ncbi:MAG: TldD/PmbA family protein [Planctomycetes bacterium]|nr:TldD/PmbA family protein [Planctomycetota bacterium]